MRAELASLNHCAVPFLSRAVVRLCWYYVAAERSAFQEFLIQTLDKKMKPHMKVVPEGAKIKQEFSAGRIWGGDAPIKSTAGEVNIINPG